MSCTAKRHGTRSAYNKGCRCPEAREAWRLYSKRRREHRLPAAYVDSIGSRRRIGALMIMGWSLRFINQQLGYSWSSGGSSLARYPKMRADKAKQIADLYDKLSMIPGPSKRSAVWARNAGYVPPLAWDEGTIDDPNAKPARGVGFSIDEIAVERTLSGDRPVTLTRRDLQEVIRRAHEMGLSDRQIGLLVGMSHDAVGAARRRAAERSGSSDATTGLPRIPTQRATPDQVRVSA